MSFKKAVKEQAKLRLALAALAGRGKTFTSLALGCALARLEREAGNGSGRVAVLDTERRSASLYADIFDFDVCELDSFSPLTYVEKIKEAEREGYDVIVIDSLSHAWAGKDGALEQKDKAAERSSSGNSWTAWRDVSPKHNALVDAMLSSTAHVIATMRVKMEHVQETVNGKTVIKKLGLAAIQREGMEYEFTLFGDIDDTHTLKVAKTRIHGVIALGDQFEKPGPDLAGKLYRWLMSGAKPAPRPVATAPGSVSVPEARAPDGNVVAQAVDQAFVDYLAAMTKTETLAELDSAAGGPGRPTKGTQNYATAADVYKAHRAAIEQRMKVQAGAPAEVAAS